MKKMACPALIVAHLFLATGSKAWAVTDEDLDQVRADMIRVLQRLEALETENRELRATLQRAAVVQPASAREQQPGRPRAAPGQSWMDHVRIKGDFRYRYEEIDAEGVDVRSRNRIRARAALVAQLPQDVEVTLGIASGGGEATSTTQTLGGAGSSKDLRLDLAYFRWQANDQLQLLAGKMENSFYRPASSGLIWDGDYNPEGVGMRWSSDALFLNTAVHWLESDSVRENQSFIWGVQGGITASLGAATLTTGLSYYDIPTRGDSVYFGADGEFFGNAFDCGIPADPQTCRYRHDYQEIEWFAQLSSSLFGLPATAYADVVNNRDADQFDTGWLLGVTLGSVDNPGQWKLGYQYEDLEADAVLGLLSDSDFAGGGTDGKGHRLSAAYALNRQWHIGLTWLLHNEAGENNFGEATGYDRVQVDMDFSF